LKNGVTVFQSKPAVITALCLSVWDKKAASSPPSAGNSLSQIHLQGAVLFKLMQELKIKFNET